MTKSAKKYRFTASDEKILNRVIELLGRPKANRLLDIGAGPGRLSEKLAKLGFSVSACDIQPEQFKAKGIAVKKADLSVSLPYLSDSFDFVTCVEVLEHLENPWQACREITRVLKKKGVLVLTVPNFAGLISRWVFLIRGNFRLFDEWTFKHWGHLNPITFTELSLILKKTGFKIEDVQTQEENEQPYAFFLRLFQKTLSIVFHVFKLIRQGEDRQDKILSVLETRPLLFGENLIIKCQKH